MDKKGWWIKRNSFKAQKCYLNRTQIKTFLKSLFSFLNRYNCNLITIKAALIFVWFCVKFLPGSRLIAYMKGYKNSWQKLSTFFCLPPPGYVHHHSVPQVSFWAQLLYFCCCNKPQWGKGKITFLFLLLQKIVITTAAIIKNFTWDAFVYTQNI